MRLLDLLVSLIGLVFLSPIFLIASLVIKFTSPGPILHCGERVGLNGKLFTLYKFRTMTVDAATMGPGITANNDPRITRVGRLLRRTKIDELPQLINVLKGDMGLVGPRPEDPRYVALYTEEQRKVLQIKPGITSLASLAYRSEETILTGDRWEHIYTEQVLPHKLAIEIEYLKKRTFWNDFLIIVRTILALFRGK